MTQPTSPSIHASEMHKDASRRLGRPNPEVTAIDPRRDTTREFHRLSAIQGKLINPNRVPSKAAGRKGTRRAWKRAHPPGQSFFDRFLQPFARNMSLSYEAVTRAWRDLDG